MPTITFATLTQAIIFVNEIRGQISDGHWENSGPRDHWKPWCTATVKVGPITGRDFNVLKDNYALTSKDLLDVVGDRMIAYARYARAVQNGPSTADNDALIKRARDMRSAIKHFDTATDDLPEWCIDEGALLRDNGTFELMRADAYGMKELKADLRAIKQAMKTRV